MIHLCHNGLLRLRVTQNALQFPFLLRFACNAKGFVILIIFFSLFFSTANMDGLFRLAQFGHTGERLCDKYMFQSEIS